MKEKHCRENKHGAVEVMQISPPPSQLTAAAAATLRPRRRRVYLYSTAFFLLHPAEEVLAVPCRGRRATQHPAPAWPTRTCWEAGEFSAPCSPSTPPRAQDPRCGCMIARQIRASEALLLYTSQSEVVSSSALTLSFLFCFFLHCEKIILSKSTFIIIVKFNQYIMTAKIKKTFELIY